MTAHLRNCIPSGTQKGITAGTAIPASRSPLPCSISAWSDFRIVADYFVQMRRNRDYKPSDIQFRHVREVLQLMSVLTRDSRFEDAANAAMEGGEAANMCEVLDRAEKRGELKGKREGRLEKSKETAARLKARGFSNSDISDIVDIDIKTIDSWFPDDV